MDLKQLTAFLTVAETGNVTRAAEMLHVVQPAISRHLQLLEDDLGVPLFTRERRGMVLTEAGTTFAAYARRAMLELERARAEVGGSAQDPKGLVTIGLLPSVADLLSSPLVGALALRYPGIRVRIAMGYAGTLSRWLQSGEVDCALLYGSERAGDQRFEPLVEEPLWVIGGPEARLKRSAPVALPALRGRRMVLPSAPHGLRTLVDHACAVAKVDLDIVAETNALSVQRSLVLGGHGLTILPPIAVADDLRSGQLGGAPLCEPDLARTIVLALPSPRASTRPVQCAVELLIDCARRAVRSKAWIEGRWLKD